MEVVKSFPVSTTTDTLQLNLYKDRLTVVKDNEVKRSFQLEDVIGLKIGIAKALESVAPETDRTTYCPVELCTYSVIQTSSQRTTRSLKFIYFFFNHGNSFEDNKTAAIDCKDCIQRQCWENDRRIFTTASTSAVYEPKRLLIVINPFSGTKNGLRDYKQTVEPLLEIGGVVVDHVLITERPNHAKEFIQSFDFSRINGIVCVGGDGTLYELINGMKSRQDDVMNIPIGVIPTGSGNGVLSSLLYEQSEEYSILSAVYQVIRGGSRVIDLAKVTMPTRQMYMFLSLTWGIIADIDIESEAFRFMGGELRTTIGGLKCILQKRIYRGRVSYILANEEEESDNGGMQRYQGGHREGSNNGASNEKSKAGLNETTPTSLEEQCEYGLTSANITADSANIIADSANNEATTLTKCDESSSINPKGMPLDNPSLPAAEDDDNWITLEHDYVTVLIGLAPMVSNKLFGHPDAILGSGHMYIMYAHSQAKRMELLNAMIAMETGEHIGHDIVHCVRGVRACRLEPLTSAGRIVIDGEEVEYGAVLVEMDGTMTVYSRNRRTS